MIVCLEGVDGSGKGTQAALLAERMNARVIKLPNADTVTGRMIYAHLEGRWHTEVEGMVPLADEAQLDAMTLQALFTVNRLEMAAAIAPYRQDPNRLLVLDRYWPSAVVYGEADGLDREWLLEIHRSLPQPDVMALVDIDPADGIRRRSDRRDRYEADDRMELRCRLYRELWGTPYGEGAPWKGTARWRVVDGRKAQDEVYSEILRSLLTHQIP